MSRATSISVWRVNKPCGASAMAEGTRFGREPKLTKTSAREALKRVAAGEPLHEIALSYAVDHATISRLKVRMPPR